MLMSAVIRCRQLPDGPRRFPTILLLLVTLMYLAAHASGQTSLPSALSTTPLPPPSTYPAPLSSLAPSLLVYGSTQSVCRGSQGGVTQNTFCAQQTPPLILVQNSCQWFASFPALPNSPQTLTALAYMFDSQWNLNFYSVATPPSSNAAGASPGCSSTNLLVTMANPQWNMANSCSIDNATQWYQFGWSSTTPTIGLSPIVNGSMFLDAAGLGYQNSPLGYFWPYQPNCTANPFPSLSTPQVPAGSPIITPPASFGLNPCMSNNPNQTSINPYSMSITVGIINPCPTGCDGMDLRTCLQAGTICLEDLPSTDIVDQCTCYQSTIPLCSFVARNCTDAAAMYQINQLFIAGTSICQQAGQPLSLSSATGQPMPPTCSSCPSCASGNIFAVFFALLFGFLVIFVLHQKYSLDQLNPLKRLRQHQLQTHTSKNTMDDGVVATHL